MKAKRLKEKELLNILKDKSLQYPPYSPPQNNTHIDNNINQSNNHNSSDIKNISPNFKKQKRYSNEGNTLNNIESNQHVEYNVDDKVDNEFQSLYSQDSLESLFRFLFESTGLIVGHGDVIPLGFNTLPNDISAERKAEWLGKGINIGPNRTYYEAVKINGEVFRIFDHVALKSQRTRQQMRTIARIIAFYEEQSRRYVTLEWFYRPQDIISVMNRLKITGHNPLSPEGKYGNTLKIAKKKRGRPPNKRLLNIEDSITTLEASHENEVFTSLMPYIDSISISAIDFKCTVEHVFPTTIPKIPSDRKNNYFFYRKALELKTCSLIICKQLPDKPQTWIELVEKKSKEKKHYYYKDRIDISKSPSSLDGVKTKKKKKRESRKFDFDEFEIDDDVTSESDISEDFSIRKQPTTRLPRQDYTQQTSTQGSSTQTNINRMSDLIFPYLLEKLETMSKIVTRGLITMQEMVENMHYDVHVNLDEIKGSLDELKKSSSNMSGLNMGPSEHSVDDITSFNNTNMFSNELFNIKID